MYDPTVGRWLNLDPLGFDAGDANPTRYISNGPTNATDPSGLEEPKGSPGFGIPPVADHSIRHATPKPTPAAALAAVAAEPARPVLGLGDQLHDEYIRLCRITSMTPNQKVATLIRKALELSRGDAALAFGAVQGIRKNKGDNDTWASIDHFFQSWATRSVIPIGMVSFPVAWSANSFYSLLKVSDWTRLHMMPRDDPRIPPTPLTPMQYEWGAAGSLISGMYPYGLTPGTAEWEGFMRFVEAEGGCYLY